MESSTESVNIRVTSGALAYCATVCLPWRRRSDPENAEAGELARVAGFAGATRTLLGRP
jgi:hypothetical protein